MQKICQRCGYRWDYKGLSTWFTSCPKCRTSISVHTPLRKLSVPSPTSDAKTTIFYDNVGQKDTNKFKQNITKMIEGKYEYEEED